jgi:probable rRNA maturation factor
MPLSVDVTTDGVRASVSKEALADVARTVLKAERAGEVFLSIALVSDRAIAAINRKHLGHAGATDVISFAFRDGAKVVGDVYIAPGVARANAKAFGCGVREELARLVVHGTLHVLGWDHPEGDARMASPMWARQERLLARAWARHSR